MDRSDEYGVADVRAANADVLSRCRSAVREMRIEERRNTDLLDTTWADSVRVHIARTHAVRAYAAPTHTT